MSDVKRFEIEVTGENQYREVEVSDGSYVAHRDYAALKAERDALAAENLEMKDAIDCHRAGFTVCESCGEESEGRNDDVCLVLNKTPDTDAIKRQWMAEGVDEFANDLRLRSAAAHENGHEIIAGRFSEYTDRAERFAARLRKGGE